MLRTVWHIYTQAVGIAVLAAAVSLGVIRLLSSEGPVVEAVEPAEPIATRIPYRGTLVYRVRTRRMESCEGTVIYTFIRGIPAVSVVMARPVQSHEIRAASDRVVRIELPDSVFPGPWKFQSLVDSRCPAYARQDVIAEFDVEVVPPEAPEAPDARGE